VLCVLVSRGCCRAARRARACAVGFKRGRTLRCCRVRWRCWGAHECTHDTAVLGAPITSVSCFRGFNSFQLHPGATFCWGHMAANSHLITNINMHVMI
jgi:hypothetical protein